MNDVTILVNSCDKYEDAWEPFFKLLKIHWPECENYRIVLNTETKKYFCDFLNVETICSGKNITWSKRLKNVLNQIETEYVLYFLEDFFLMQRVSNETFDEAVELIKSDSSIGYIGLKYNPTRVFKKPQEPIPTERFFSKDVLVTVNRVNSMTALWRKEWLSGLLRDHETPWDFEKYGSVRSRRTDKKVLVINNCDNICPPVFDYDVDVVYGHGIVGGKWLPKNEELFSKFGVEVNFENLGINYDLYNRAIGIDVPAPVQPEMNLKERLYRVKRWFIRAKKKTIKKIRAIKSLI